VSGNWTVRGAKIALGSVTGIASPADPTQWWLALGAGSADPALDPTIFTELPVTNYARQTVTWTYGGDVYAINNSQITFADLGSANVRGLRIYDDDDSLANLLWWADLTNVISFSAGHTINFPMGIIRAGFILI
jgi:hypothetical protein